MRCSLQSILEYNKAISSCTKSTEWQAALQLFADLDLKGFQATVVTYNSAINACAQAANWRSAMLLLKNMEGVMRGLQANIISYSTAITSCEKAGQWQVAVELLEALKLKRLQLNIIAFNAVITACAKGCLHNSLGLVNLVIELKSNKFMEVCAPVAHLFWTCWGSDGSLKCATCFSQDQDISRCSRGEEWQHSLSLLEAVQEANLTGSVVTYNACISFLTADGSQKSLY